MHKIDIYLSQSYPQISTAFLRIIILNVLKT